jgi:hypothetical protein
LSHQDELTVLAAKLDYIKARIYTLHFPGRSARLVPDDNGTPDWAESITVGAYSDVGSAKLFSNYADDLPRADIEAAYRTVKVKTLGDSYGFNVNELRASRATSLSLDFRKAEGARSAIELKVADIRLHGDPDYGLYGLFTVPGLPRRPFAIPALGSRSPASKSMKTLSAWSTRSAPKTRILTCRRTYASHRPISAPWLPSFTLTPLSSLSSAKSTPRSKSKGSTN